MQFRGHLAAKALELADFLDGGGAQTVNAAEMGEQRGTAHRAESGEVVEDALANFLGPEDGVRLVEEMPGCAAAIVTDRARHQTKEFIHYVVT